MQTNVNEIAVKIGRVIQDARLKNGFVSRSSLIESKQLRGRLSGEGLRKIENGERVPRQENIELLGKVLGLPDKKVKELQTLAMGESIKRATRRAGNVDVTFEIEGKSVKVAHLPPLRKAEMFTRQVVDELVTLVDMYGVLDEDISHFRRHARSVILRHLSDS